LTILISEALDDTNIHSKQLQVLQNKSHGN